MHAIMIIRTTVAIEQKHGFHYNCNVIYQCIKIVADLKSLNITR